MKPNDARHKTNATRFNDVLDKDTLKYLFDKVMDAHFIVKVPDYNCILSTRTGSQDMPQLKTEINGTKIQILCTHAVALYANKTTEYWFDTLSHICGIRMCINPNHLIWEHPWDNVSRDGCHKYHFWKECIHEPKCLPEPPFEICKEAIDKQRTKMENKRIQDPKKMKKRENNKKQYEQRKQRKLELENPK